MLKKILKKYHKANLDDLFGLTELYKSDNDFLKTLITHQWDCDWFLSEDETFENLKILYSQMDLGEINEELIRKMYRIWLKKWIISRVGTLKILINLCLLQNNIVLQVVGQVRGGLRNQILPLD